MIIIQNTSVDGVLKVKGLIYEDFIIGSNQGLMLYLGKNNAGFAWW